MTTDLRYPDLEVYIKSSELDALAAMLDQMLPLTPWERSDSVYCARIELQSENSEVHLRAGAYKKFTSIWIKTNVTTWATDHDLALALSQSTDLEIRCSIGSWSGVESDEPELWWRVKNGLSQQVQWS
jgi:hypothetical protein